MGIFKRFAATQHKVRAAGAADVDEINALEPEFEKLSDDQLRDKTTEFINRHLKGESLEDLLPEAFAAVREAAKRTLGSATTMCSSSAASRSTREDRRDQDR